MSKTSNDSANESSLIEPHIHFYQQRWNAQGDSLTRVLDELNLTTEDTGSSKNSPITTLTKVDSDNSKEETICEEQSDKKDSGDEEILNVPKVETDAMTILGKRSRCVEDDLKLIFELEPPIQKKNLSWQCLKPGG